MSRRLVIGLFALIVAMLVTIWTLVLVREEPPPAPPARAERPASPDATDDATADEQRKASAAASSAAAGASTNGAPPAAAAPPSSSESSAANEVAAVPVPVSPPVLAPAPAPAAEPEPVAVPPAASPAVVEAAPVPVETPKPTVEPARPTQAADTGPTPPVADAVAPLIAPEAPPSVQQAVVLPPRAPPILAPEPPPADRPAIVLPPTVAPPPAVAAAPPPPPPAPRRVAPSFDVVRVAVDGTAVIAGRAEAGALVQIFDGEREIGRATADSRGEWVVLPAGAMTSGTRELSLLSRGPGDIPDLRSERVVVVVVPERQQAAQAGGALAVSMPRDASVEPSRALQVPSAAPRQGPAITLAVETVDYDATGNVVLSGRGAAGSTVLIYLDGRVIGRVTCDGDGRWSLTPEGTVAPGVYTLRVDQLGADGRVAQRMEMPFSRAEPTTDLANSSGERIIVQPGNSLWRIARRVYGEGLRYSIIYQANREMIRDPDLIYPGQVFAVPPRP